MEEAEKLKRKEERMAQKEAELKEKESLNNQKEEELKDKENQSKDTTVSWKIWKKEHLAFLFWIMHPTQLVTSWMRHPKKNVNLTLIIAHYCLYF